MKEKKVLHVIKGLGRGGAERLLVSTIRQHNKSYHFDVVYFLPWKNQLVPDLTTLGCTVHCFSARNIFQILLKLPALCNWIRAHRYDIIHAHLPWTGIMARMAGKVTGVPVVYTEHNMFSRYKNATRIFNKLTFEWQANVIAVSEEVEKAIRKEVNPTVPVRTIMNGVDTHEFDRSKYQVDQLKAQYNLPEASCIIGTVAVFRPQKRLDRWIRIAEQVSKKNPSVYFVLVGDGLLRAELEQQAGKLVDDKKLIFAGLSAEPERWMACMDIYLMSSDFEGLPVALLEAMSMGCVPVVTRAGGIPAVIDHEKNGFLYDADDVKKAVSAIEELITHPEKRNQMSRAARSSIENNYGIGKMVKALEEVYEGIIENPS